MPPSTIPAVFREQVQALQARPMAYGKVDAHWRPLTWAQMGERVAHAAAGLCALGLEPADRVAIWARSSPEWVLADLATLSCGACDVPIYDTATPGYVSYVLADSGARVLFVDGPAQFEVLAHLRDRAPQLTHVIYLQDEVPPPAVEGLTFVHLLELERLGRDRGDEADVDARVAALRPDDLLTLIYTSGTTGQAKGVMVTHANMTSNCEAAARALPIKADDHLLSFLPLSHSFERMAGYYMATLYGGATLHYAQGMGKLFHNMAEVRPTLMTGVPRVYEKVYHRFLATLEAAPPVRRRLLEQALRVGREVARMRQDHRRPGDVLALQYKLAYGQVFAPLAARMGGRIRFLVSGGAPLAPEVAEFFLAAGLLILEGYGLSEAAPVVSVNRPGAFRFGTVGRPLDHVRVRLGEDGEILVFGPNVMRGYFNRPEDTAEVLTDGWLATGDVGELDREGFLRITDRKKDLFKTSTGKYIAPQMLEGHLKRLRFVEQAAVVGDRRPYCVALLVPSFDALADWAREKGIPATDREALVRDPKVLRRFQHEVDRLNGTLERHETLKAFRLLTEPFTEANGLLTHSLKVRRKAVLARHAALVEGMYAQGAHRHRWRRR